jgi:hypothetical protein
MVTGSDFEVVPVVRQNLEASCRSAREGGYSIFLTFAGGGRAVNGVNNELDFGTSPSADFFAVGEARCVVFGTFAADDFALDVSLMEDGTAEFNGLVVDKVGVSLPNVEGCAHGGCNSYSG